MISSPTWYTLFPYTTLFRSLLRCRPRTARVVFRHHEGGAAGDFQVRVVERHAGVDDADRDRKSTRLNSIHVEVSYDVFCLKKKTAVENLHSLLDANRTTSMN